MTLPHKIIGVAVIKNERGEILIDKRLPKGNFGGLWEFPGGKLEAGETIQNCIKREIMEELAIEIEVEKHFVTIEYVDSKLKLTLEVYECRHLQGIPQPRECEEIRWVNLEELESFSFHEANTQIIAKLQES
jgi:mutator protein MutT